MTKAGGTQQAVKTVSREELERQYEAELKRLQHEAEARVEIIRESRRVSDKDLQIRINTR